MPLANITAIADRAIIERVAAADVALSTPARGSTLRRPVR